MHLQVIGPAVPFDHKNGHANGTRSPAGGKDKSVLVCKLNGELGFGVRVGCMEMGHGSDLDSMLAGVERGQAVVVCFELTKDIPEADNIYIQVGCKCLLFYSALAS